MPAQHKLEGHLDEYLDAAGIRKDPKRDALLSFSLNDWQDRRAHILRHDRVDVWRMIRRRVADAGMAFRIGKIGCHTFRATGIAAYDRTADAITLDEVERIVSCKSDTILLQFAAWLGRPSS